MKSTRVLALLSTIFLFAFYVGIVMYVILTLINPDGGHNFVSGMTFEIIGFVILFLIITCNLFGKPIKTGYLIPMVMCTVGYTILLDSLNFLGMVSLSSGIFILLHLILLFATLLIVLPMLVMGKR